MPVLCTILDDRGNSCLSHSKVVMVLLLVKGNLVSYFHKFGGLTRHKRHKGMVKIDAAEAEIS